MSAVAEEVVQRLVRLAGAGNHHDPALMAAEVAVLLTATPIRSSSMAAAERARVAMPLSSTPLEIGLAMGIALTLSIVIEGEMS